MALIFALPNFYTAAAAIKSSENASFPASNIGLYDSPHQPWFSNSDIVSGTTYVGVDLGATIGAKLPAAIIIDNLNIDTIQIQGASDPGFAVGMLTTGDITVNAYAPERSLWDTAAGQSQGRRKIIYLTAGSPLGIRRYWRVLAKTNTLIDGTSGSGAKMSVGSMILAPSIITLDGGLSSYGELGLEATHLNDDFDGGGSDPVILGNPGSGIILGASVADRTASRADLHSILRCGLGRHFVVYKNDGDTSEFVIGHRVGDVTVTQTSPSGINYQQFAIEGVS